jgi:hypothetical protein
MLLTPSVVFAIRAFVNAFFGYTLKPVSECGRIPLGEAED